LSPATAPRALALLHELSVHQVELEIQSDELRRSRAELEASLARMTQLYDFAPVGCFTVDPTTVIHELNLTGASMLGAGRDILIGQRLDLFLSPESARKMHLILARPSEAGIRSFDSMGLTLAQPDAPPIAGSVCRDPAGQRFFVGFVRREVAG